MKGEIKIEKELEEFLKIIKKEKKIPKCGNGK